MKHTPMRRFGNPAELAGATLLLTSEAGSFMTGAEIFVDGGFEFHDHLARKCRLPVVSISRHKYTSQKDDEDQVS